ncbi:hypothetical protein DL98DRAFT_239679 [Cadophora sp. DSE1049]|nr:hypothetical protein DL98DRAFT_239679 [Cadophora sp. DSE1049]
MLFNLTNRGAECNLLNSLSCMNQSPLSSQFIYLNGQTTLPTRPCLTCCISHSRPATASFSATNTDANSQGKHHLFLDALHVSLVCRQFHTEIRRSHLLYRINWFGFNDYNGRFPLQIESLSSLQLRSLRSITLRMEIRLTGGRFNVFWSKHYTMRTLRKCTGLRNLDLVLEFESTEVEHSRLRCWGF